MPLPSNVVGGTVIASAWGNAVVASLPQIGFIGLWGGDTAPADYLMCRGQAVSRTTYAALFALVGTRFGSGDTSTTFNVPDLRGRYPVGYNVGGTYFTAGVGERYGSTAVTLPAHQHGVPNHVHPFNVNSGGFSQSHYHQEQIGTIIRANPFAPAFWVHVTGGGGFDIASELFDTGGTTVGWASHDHVHNVAGNTAGADRDLTSTVAGGDASLGNLPPSLSLNFIIRAL